MLKLDVSSKDPKKKAHPEKADDWTFGSCFEPDKIKSWLWDDPNGAIRAEMGSCGNSASARGLAKLAAMVANGGSWDGVEYISPEVWTEMHSDEYTHFQGMTGFVCSYTKGGFLHFQSNAEILKKCPEEAKHLVGKNEEKVTLGRDGFYGWCGSGGCLIQHHPELKIGFGFVTNQLEPFDGYYRKSAQLQGVVKKCAEAMKK